MATASRGRCDTWEMGIGASGRSLLSIEVPNGRELPFSVAVQPEGECGVKAISRFEKGRSWVYVASSPLVVARLYLFPPRRGTASQICTDEDEGERDDDCVRIAGGDGAE